jgi:hypothetical protein
MKIRLFLIAAAFGAAAQVHAYSAIAMVPDNSTKSIFAAYNWATQKQADSEAIIGCKRTSKNNDLAKQSSKCKVMARQKGSGYGAIVCGDSGCSWATGHDSKQPAIDTAWNKCNNNKLGNCQESDILAWEDTNWPQARTQAKSNASCSPPAGKVLRTSDRCYNGDCIRTFENGCQVRFQAPYCFDSFKGQWEWKPNGC